MTGEQRDAGKALAEDPDQAGEQGDRRYTPEQGPLATHGRVVDHMGSAADVQPTEQWAIIDE